MKADLDDEIARRSRERKGTPASSSSLMTIEDWIEVWLDVDISIPAYAEGMREARAIAAKWSRTHLASYRKVKVARRGRSLYLLTPIRRGPK